MGIRLRLNAGISGVDPLNVPQQLLEPAAKLQPGVPLAQGGVVRLAVVQRLHRFLQRHIQLDRRQLVGQIGALALRLQLGRHALGTAKVQGRHLIQRRIDVIQATQPL